MKEKKIATEGRLNGRMELPKLFHTNYPVKWTRELSDSLPIYIYTKNI